MVPETVLFCFGGQFVEHLLALGLVALLVREQIGGIHAAMCSDHAVWKLAIVEEGYEVRP